MPEKLFNYLKSLLKEDLESYGEKQFSYLQEKLIILSPIYGPLHSDTEIWPFRLEMRLKPDGINLYDY